LQWGRGSKFAVIGLMAEEGEIPAVKAKCGSHCYGCK